MPKGNIKNAGYKTPCLNENTINPWRSIKSKPFLV
jgi:hypothetical protein